MPGLPKVAAAAYCLSASTCEHWNTGYHFIPTEVTAVNIVAVSSGWRHHGTISVAGQRGGGASERQPLDGVRWIEEGRLKATKIGKSSLRVFHDSALALVEENQIEEGNHPINALQANRHPAPICVAGN